MDLVCLSPILHKLPVSGGSKWNVQNIVILIYISIHIYTCRWINIFSTKAHVAKVKVSGLQSLAFRILHCVSTTLQQLLACTNLGPPVFRLLQSSKMIVSLDCSHPESPLRQWISRACPATCVETNEEPFSSPKSRVWSLLR